MTDGETKTANSSGMESSLPLQRGVSHEPRLLPVLERIAVALQAIVRVERLEMPGGSSGVGKAAGSNGHDQASSAIGTPGVASDTIPKLETQLTEIRDLLQKQEKLIRPVEKKCYSVDEVAGLTSYKAWTIRQGCNKGRIKGQKGDDGRWRISHDELVRLQEDGLPAG